jgi:transcriptional regulator with XRE-family HTH domain
MTSTVLADARHRAGMTQDAVAELAGTSAPRLSAYERAHVSPTLSTAQRILEAEGFELSIRPTGNRTINYGTYRGRPIEIPTELPGLNPDAAFATIRLPLHVQWSRPDETFNLADRSDRAAVYSIVLREGTPADVVALVDPLLLFDLWEEIALPKPIRAAWEKHFVLWGLPC